MLRRRTGPAEPGHALQVCDKETETDQSDRGAHIYKVLRRPFLSRSCADPFRCGPRQRAQKYTYRHLR